MKTYLSIVFIMCLYSSIYCQMLGPPKGPKLNMKNFEENKETVGLDSAQTVNSQNEQPLGPIDLSEEKDHQKSKGQYEIPITQRLPEEQELAQGPQQQGLPQGPPKKAFFKNKEQYQKFKKEQYQKLKQGGQWGNQDNIKHQDQRASKYRNDMKKDYSRKGPAPWRLVKQQKQLEMVEKRPII